MDEQPVVRGVRFAPSPTGRFHVGNLRTAWISREIARLLNEPWIVRFEDIDRPRVIPGAREQQLEDLERLGLVPDQIVLQSENHSTHFDYFKKAIEGGIVYPCDCSRKEVAEALRSLASAPHAPLPIYSGECRHRSINSFSSTSPLGWRFRSAEGDGRNDFLIGRSNGIELKESEFTPAYQWATAIDDLLGGYSTLVRAWDLEKSAEEQRRIQRWIDPKAELPRVFHSALVVQDSGHRLEKRTKGVTLEELVPLKFSVGGLIEMFQKSFSLLEFDPGVSSLSGESRKQIKLRELGIPSTEIESKS